MSAVHGVSSGRKPSRRQPRSVVARAAVQAALKLGYEQVTVELICSEADISRSTFFNHFPSRDAAIIGKPFSVPGPEVTGPVLSRYPEDLVRSLLEMQVPVISSRTEDADILRDRARLITEQPAAMRQYSTGLIAVQNDLTDAAEGWLRANPQHARLPGRPRTEAVLAVTAAYAAMHAASDWWHIPLRDQPDPLSACFEAVDALRIVSGVGDSSRSASVPDIPAPDAPAVPARPPGLRERKRRDTENRIELAAAGGALERGFTAVTVDEICAEANISRSTFFNYFPSREAAIVGRPLELLPSDAAWPVLAQHGGDTPSGIFALIFASAAQTHVSTEVARLRAELGRNQPAARDAGTATLVDAGTRIMGTVRDWLTENPDNACLPGKPAYEASLASNAAYAAISALATGWLTAVSDPLKSADGFAVAMDDLRDVLAAAGPAV